jgi:hypothetical protein
MIYVGYQGVGKSSVSGKNNFIDLESGNFWVDGNRCDNWHKIYCNIAGHLSSQGYNVFMSSHKIVRQELNVRNMDFYVIAPCLDLKEEWITRLQSRYDKSGLEKDYKALMNARDCFEDNIKDLLSEKNQIQICTIDYDLAEVIKGYQEYEAEELENELAEQYGKEE